MTETEQSAILDALPQTSSVKHKFLILIALGTKISLKIPTVHIYYFMLFLIDGTLQSIFPSLTLILAVNFIPIRNHMSVFKSQDECDHLINLAKPHMEKSTVVDNDTGKSKDSRVRTSSGTFLARGVDETVAAIEKRIADFTFLPVENGEGLQVLHYEVGQKYEPHYDYFLDQFNTVNGGQRMATVLMYLSDVEEGGETVFPSAKGNISAVPWWNELSECGKEGLSVKPKMGDALLFWSMRPDASLDSSSLHGGCPVIRGNKWSSTKWIHVEEYKVFA
ncbi:2-oxoglutarate (2OG) and Fe(II)-dependent oxygenase superfamily protein [Artemisia annua]|uniref:procollagen-proline 4-dioxygenase n=1 Tax=Artemisia annua TaxID=35608 RepID=A0A2U1NN71_ARTAN|nr:2-oxoglutarate (2OG) and Fe(II)-dependent oxygenase superfamily protein [Artemisia annua]